MMAVYNKYEDKPADTVAVVYPPMKRKKHSGRPEDPNAVSNEYALNFAFLSFLGFTILQLIFALTAKSQAMLADCAAMSVDCVTYLFNFCAERLKHHNDDDDDEEKKEYLLSESDLYEHHYQRKMKLLYLEVVPPLISVSTLAVVTVLALTQAMQTLLSSDAGQSDDDQPDLFLMLLFSGINFVLDGINVLCFARADQAKGLSLGVSQAYQLHCKCDNPPPITTTTTLPSSRRVHQPDCPVSQTTAAPANESTHLVSSSTSETAATADDEDSTDSDNSGLNLNMCSAWTHICADTLRSIAVLLAAGFAKLFPSVLTAADADSYGAVFVSLIIIVSLAPLVEGLYFTIVEIHQLKQERNQVQQQQQRQQEAQERISSFL